MNQQLRILEGATFCICDELGDLHGKVEGLFAQDTRFLSALKLTINGQRPLLLSSDKIEYFSAAFFMRNPFAGGLAQDVLSIRRERFVGDGMQDSFMVENESMERIELDFELDVAADFADIFAVKDFDFALGDPMRAKPLPDPRPVEYDPERNQFLISDDGDLPLKTQVIFSERGEVKGSMMTYHLVLEPRERWSLHVEVFPLPDGELVAPRFAELRFGEEVGRVRDSLAAWQLRVPQLRASWDALSHAFGQSVSDLASLRMRSDNGAIGARASVPSWKRCESQESFHDWFSRPRSVRRSYSTKPSPSRSPYCSIHPSAASAGCLRLRTSAASSVHRHTSESRIR